MTLKQAGELWLDMACALSTSGTYKAAKAEAMEHGSKNENMSLAIWITLTFNIHIKTVSSKNNYENKIVSEDLKWFDKEKSLVAQ